MIEQQVDVLIIGGGLTGATLMLALSTQGYRTLLVETQTFSNKLTPEFDARTLALSPASVSILQGIGLWPLLVADATPIIKIHVSEQGRFGHTRLQGQTQQPLGYVMELQAINRALYHLLAKQKMLAPAKLLHFDQQQQVATINYQGQEQKIKTQLLVAADGSHSLVRQLMDMPVHIREYEQQALVTNIGLARNHQNQAYERFTDQGPLALLPMTAQRSALIWCLTSEKAHYYKTMEESLFLKSLQETFGYRLGRFIKVGQRTIFPLCKMLMPAQINNQVVFVGNAAHTLHPIAGQGFNLGLRDVATLAQCIIKQGLNSSMLANYQQLRHFDQQAIIKFTHGLVKTFGNPLPGLGISRGLGLLAMDSLPSLQNLLKRYAGGYAGMIPDLVCGIALDEERIHESSI